MKIIIIDPSSTEQNRGSFCYAAYLLYNVLMETKDKEDEIIFLESFLSENLDDIPDADEYIVSLWSYPQVEACVMLAHFLPFMYGKDNVNFIGYTGLINEIGLPHMTRSYGSDPLQDPNFLRIAMRAYPKYYSHFNRLLLSDCDMHLKHLEEGEKVYPLFTSYGCPRACQFCPSTINCGYQRIEVPILEVKTMLKECIVQGIHNIHFTDEDFFFDIDRAYKILAYLEDEDMHLIALGSADKVVAFIDKYGTEIIGEAGLEVIEIGFESGDEHLSHRMGKGKSLSDCETLALMNVRGELPFDIFWLILTFFPGETIHTLNKTGEFMERYGFEITEVVGRLRTNGTKGGLGQFFQPYHGTALYKTLEDKGYIITRRPVRLLPSYVPNSFLQSEITFYNENRLKFAFPYIQMYNVNMPNKPIEIGMKISDFLSPNPTMYELQKTIILFAILAREGVIQ